MARISAKIRPQFPAEIICWIDHSEPVGKRVWDTATPPEELFGCVVFTAGFVVSENPQIVEIARDLSEHGAVGGCLHILKNCIVARKRMRPPTVRRKDTVDL
jgi:hypothetical protein